MQIQMHNIITNWPSSAIHSHNNVWMRVYLCGCQPGAMNGQISQIPGLSPVVKIPPEEKTQRQRGIVKESDSEYIKLAKRGGHKGRASVQSSHPSESKSLISALSRHDGGQDSCGTRTSPNPKSLHTNLLTGSYLCLSKIAQGICDFFRSANLGKISCVLSDYVVSTEITNSMNTMNTTGLPVSWVSLSTCLNLKPVTEIFILNSNSLTSLHSY